MSSSKKARPGGLADTLKSSADVAAWGEEWLAAWIAEYPPKNRGDREEAAARWRARTLEQITEEWRQGRANPSLMFDGASTQRQFLNHEINEQAKLYGMTGNGLAIWILYRMVREAGLSPPEGILAKFDEWGTALEQASGADDVARAIEMSDGKRGAQGAAALKKAERRRAIASSVHDHLGRGHTPQEAFNLTARNHGTTAPAVKALWHRWTAEIEEANEHQVAARVDGAMRSMTQPVRKTPK